MRIQTATPTLPTAAPISALETASQTTTHKNRFSTSRMAGSNPVWKPQADLQADFSPSAKTASGVKADQQLSFKDMLDVINPLQHIPVVNTYYRKMTGDQISPPAQLMGGMLFTGPIGAVSAIADIAIRDRTGKGFTENMAALVNDYDNAFKRKIPEFEIGADDTLNNIATAAGPARSFGAQPRTAGTMPLWNGAQFAALIDNLTTENPNIS